MPGRLIALAFGTALVAGTSACSATGLDFRADGRLTITTPADRSGVTVPVPVAWTLSDPRPSEESFVVLVDVSPPRPGTPITDLLPEDQRNPEACDAECQTAALAARGVLLTAADEVIIPALPRPTGMSDEQSRRHRITVIVLDAEGRRSGELSDSVDVDEVFK